MVDTNALWCDRPSNLSVKSSGKLHLLGATVISLAIVLLIDGLLIKKYVSDSYP